MRMLAAAKLVSLSEEETAELAAQSSSETPSDDYAADLGTLEIPPAPEPVASTVVVTEIAEGKAFETIFSEANLPASPFPAERLLRLLDGLQAMDEATRKAAVKAMDAADDSWTIDDPVLDAQRKIGVLEAYSQALAQQVTQNEQDIATEVAQLKATEEKAIAEIRQQISGLEKLLEREIQKTAEHINTRQSGLAAERKAVDALVETEEFFTLLAKQESKPFIKGLFKNLVWTGLEDNARILGLVGGTNHPAQKLALSDCVCNTRCYRSLSAWRPRDCVINPAS